MPRLLIIEDDPKIIEAIEKTVSLARHYAVKAVSNADRALQEVLRYKPDLILLDVKLPNADGRVILKSLKANPATQRIPVIFLTGMSSEGDKVLGLNLGADDYVVKPFGAMELLARIEAVFRRYRPEPVNRQVIRISGFKLDLENRTASLRAKPLKLQPKEFGILWLLASNPGRSLSRSYLIENSSSYGMPVSTRSLDTHIKNLRKKLQDLAGLIQTVQKFGYRFVPGND